jgi:phosphate transport system substrate-binding protein
MVNLAQAWAEEYMNENPLESMAVTGGGSGTGIAALIAGATDIAESSRNMQQKEIKLAEARGVRPKEIQVASDGITMVVHLSNPVNKLTRQQLSDIYTGKVKNWKDLGGLDQKIVALSRERNSGTHVFFLEHVVKLGDKKNKNEFFPEVLMMPSSQAIIEEVQGNPQAIGYVGLGYLTSKEKALSIAKDDKSPYVYPTIQTVNKNLYPISRSLLFYINGEPNQRTRPFIDFVLSPKGQAIVLEMDFVPVKMAPK